MLKKDVWGKIKKTVADGVAAAAEKTEEFTKLGRAKIDILSLKRSITQKRTDLGAVVYEAVKEGKAEGALAAPVVKGLIGEIDKLEKDLAKRQAAFDDLKRKAGSDMADVKKKAKAGVKTIAKKAKTKVGEIKKKARAKTTAKEKTEKPA
jgi:hypothetical protein